jgi:hypothetical protein
MPRQTLYALLAAAFAAGTLAAPAEAATRHHAHHHTSHMHATSATHGGRTAQDNSADALNAQSLARTQSGSGAMQAPMAPAPGAMQAPMAPAQGVPQ